MWELGILIEGSYITGAQDTHRHCQIWPTAETANAIVKKIGAALLGA
jgi:hypothetical protein